jgi:uncharacterized protein (TIGR02118 family)
MVSRAAGTHTKISEKVNLSFYVCISAGQPIIHIILPSHQHPRAAPHTNNSAKGIAHHLSTMSTPAPGEVTTHVAYPSKDPKSGDAITFDMPYYLSKHMPLIDKVWGPHGMIRWNITEFPEKDPLNGEPLPYRVQTTVYWKSIDDFKAAMADPNSQVTGKDVQKFSNVWPVIWVGGVAGSGDRDGIERNIKEFVYGEGGL